MATYILLVGVVLGATKHRPGDTLTDAQDAAAIASITASYGSGVALWPQTDAIVAGAALAVQKLRKNHGDAELSSVLLAAVGKSNTSAAGSASAAATSATNAATSATAAAASATTATTQATNAATSATAAASSATAAAASAASVGAPSRSNKHMACPNVSAASGANICATGLVATPKGYVRAFVGPIGSQIPIWTSDGDKTGQAYWSGDAGTTARALTAVVSGDKLYFGAQFATVGDLTTSDFTDFDYNA